MLHNRKQRCSIRQTWERWINKAWVDDEDIKKPRVQNVSQWVG